VLFVIFIFIILPLLLIFYIVRYFMVLGMIREQNQAMAVKLHQDSLI